MNRSSFALASLALFVLAHFPVAPSVSASLLDQEVCPDLPATLNDAGLGVEYETYPIPDVDVNVNSKRLLPEPTFKQPDLPMDSNLDVSYGEGCLTTKSKVVIPGQWAVDANGDGMGDDWVADIVAKTGATVTKLGDLDGDGLTNVKEFQWRLVPICHAAMGQNCMDRESSPASGAGGDSWQDGAEVWFWNDPSNDDEGLYAGKAFYDPDAGRDTDGDGQVDTRDTDTDGDGLTDGVEVVTYGTYPHVVDSDCGYAPCTSSTSTRAVGPHSGNPGTGDGIQDNAELAAWNAIGASAWNTNYDGDTYPNNLLDRDADNDGLTDGEEFLSPGSQAVVTDSDTDNDGVLDGNEDAWNTDADGDGLRSVADTDSDADGMPDGWEKQWGFNMVNAADAALDGDGLSNLGEYQHLTDPSDMDSENDLLLDGEEVHTYGTNPLHWDSDGDGMPDSYEAERGFDPLDSVDAGQDADGDSFDQDWDGTPELVWSNLAEYRFGRSASYNEAASGPWMQGTDSLNPDSDNDGAWDGYEAYYGTDPHSFLSGDSDQDDDGLNFTQEIRRNSNPTDADTDNDGLCDGGRAPACLFPGLGGVPNQPGERDYGSNPWMTDSDLDGFSDSTPAATGEAQLWDPGASGSAQDVDGDLLNGVIDSDSDGDRLLDGDERNVRATDPAVPDTDADGLRDGEEALDYLTNPKDTDHDDDGLTDGAEVLVHHTRPTVSDTDGDTLGDGAEVNTHGTDPLLRDTDQDQLPDGWEIQKGTQALVADADVDLDADGLSNYREYLVGANPNDADTDDDRMPDEYEVRYGLRPAWSYDDSDDEDGDAVSNFNEHRYGTHPLVPDTDGDGLSDGAEFDSFTDPLLPDSDADGLRDGPEKSAWYAKSYAWQTDADGDTLNGLNDPDSDNDGLSDRDELVDTKTKPMRRDTDEDGLSDFDEVVTFEGQFNPNDPDTDDDGTNDGVEGAILADPDGDFDKDGLKNGEETGTYGTDPAAEDSDCDGVKDGPERIYWDADWNTGTNRLLAADVDGDSIKDGVELGSVGTPAEALYRTHPGVADTDGDGLQDNAEAQNSVRVSCGEPQGASEPESSGSAFIGPTLPSAAPLVGPTGLVFAQDAAGWFIRGGYGVRLYLVNVSVEDFLMQPQSGGAPGVGKEGVGTNPMLTDTDGDGLSDGEEATGSENDEYANASTDPIDCDTDDDGLGDGLELGVGADGNHKPRKDTLAVCQQRDADGSTKSNPKSRDTDGDTLWDGPTVTVSGVSHAGEDPNSNGKLDATSDGYGLQQDSPVATGRETGAVDADTDDDGILDLTEGSDKRLNPLLWDVDGDGLSDGLETGVKTHVILNGIDYTLPHNVLGLADWPTFQEFKGSYTNGNPSLPPLTTEVNVRDSDGDGIIDGLEDLNHNGNFSEIGELNPDGVSDTDGDGISDGRELLVYGTYTFQKFVDVRGDPAAAMQYDGALLKTDPTKPSTDLDLPGGDSIVDGKDINPRGDGLMFLQLQKFWQYDEIDVVPCWSWNTCAENYQTDLVLKIKLETGVGDFALSTTELSNFGAREGVEIQDHGLSIASKTNPPSPMTGALKAIDLASDATDTIQFDLPDNIDDFTKARDMKIHVRLDAIDRDDGPNGPNPDDSVDVSPVRGSDEFYDAGGIDLTAGALTGNNHVPLDANGNGDPDDPGSVSGDGAPGDNDDGRLLMDFHSNLVPYFLKNILGTYIPSGTCLAGVDALQRPCIT